MRLHEVGKEVVTALAIAAAVASNAAADPVPPAATVPLVGLAPAADARRSIAIGPGGEVYEPDGAGAWVRTRRIGTATTIAVVGRTGDTVVASGGGVIYKLAPNGWSAIRLAQKGDAVMSRGPRAVGAVGRQLYALDRFKGGEPEKLALAPAAIHAIGGGAGVVIAHDKGVSRVDGTKITAIGGVVGAKSFAGDRWAITSGGAIELRAKKLTAWPANANVMATSAAADDTLHAVAVIAGKLVYLELRPAAALRQTPVDADVAGARAVDVVADRENRIVIAMSDGRLVVRDKGTWTQTTVRDASPAAKPGSPPATSR